MLRPPPLCLEINLRGSDMTVFICNPHFYEKLLLEKRAGSRTDLRGEPKNLNAHIQNVTWAGRGTSEGGAIVPVSLEATKLSCVSVKRLTPRQPH